VFLNPFPIPSSSISSTGPLIDDVFVVIIKYYCEDDFVRISKAQLVSKSWMRFSGQIVIDIANRLTVRFDFPMYLSKPLFALENTNLAKEILLFHKIIHIDTKEHEILSNGEEANVRDMSHISAKERYTEALNMFRIAIPPNIYFQNGILTIPMWAARHSLLHSIVMTDRLIRLPNRVYSTFPSALNFVHRRLLRLKDPIVTVKVLGYYYVFFCEKIERFFAQVHLNLFITEVGPFPNLHDWYCKYLLTEQIIELVQKFLQEGNASIDSWPNALRSVFLEKSKKSLGINE
jgi:hypothetical protein